MKYVPFIDSPHFQNSFYFYDIAFIKQYFYGMLFQNSFAMYKVPI